jgi:hypothetical protein
MDKRLEKRHKRQVARAKLKVKVSEPDVRTPEQIEAAREVSGAKTSRGTQAKVGTAGAGNFRNNFASGKGSAAKTDS